MTQEEVELFLKNRIAEKYNPTIAIVDVKDILDSARQAATDDGNENLDVYIANVKEALDIYLEPIEMGE